MAVEISHETASVAGTRPNGSSSQLGSGYVTGRLGEGGMAVVYEIWNPQLSVSRAVKLLRSDHTPESRRRFATEVKLTAQLDHPNIIRIHSVGEWNGRPYIEMEKVNGWSLDALIRERGALPKEVGLAIALLIARALTYTHSLKYRFDGTEIRGLLHRDLKPANILLSKNGWVRLTDFGIATPVDVSMHTPDGSIVGSLHYIAPEQLKGDDVDARADMYSFGCVLYEMLSGARAFPEKKLARLIPQRLANSYTPLRKLRHRVPRTLVGLINHCMAAEAGKRPKEFRDIRKALEKLYEGWTDQAPEEIIENYLNTGKNTPNRSAVPMSGFRASPRIAVAGGIFAALVLMLFVAGGTDSGRRVMEIAKTRLPGLASRTPVPAEPPPAVRMSLDSILARLNTQDPLLAMKHEDQEGNHRAVLFLSDYLTEKKRTSMLGILLVTRALETVGGLTDGHFRTCYINEAEYALIRARYYFDKGHYISAISSLRNFEDCEALLSDSAELQLKAIKLRNDCRKALDEKPAGSEPRKDPVGRPTISNKPDEDPEQSGNSAVIAIPEDA